MKKRRRKTRRIKPFRFIFSILFFVAIVVGGIKLISIIKDDKAPKIIENLENKFIEQHGKITIKNIDTDRQFPLKNSQFSITNIETGVLVDILVTDKDGLATSDLLDYHNIYEIKQVGLNPYYQSSEGDSLTVEINKDNHEILIKNRLFEHIKHVSYTEDGEISIDEVYIDVPTVMQNPELPNGCEITSLTTVLNYKGYAVDKLEMADIYLPKVPFYRVDEQLYGADPYIAYAGDPRETSGFFSYAPPIIKAANNYLDVVQGKEEPRNISNSTHEKIIEYLEQGVPVVIWVTLDLSEPMLNYSWILIDSGEMKDMPVNLHCVVLNGYAGDNVHVMNPLEGQVEYNADDFFQSYIELGSHALIIK
ncbi:MAG: C39 family peptidase [Tissierellales bacterium]